MKFAVILFLGILYGNISYAQQVFVTPAPLPVVAYPVIVYQPVIYYMPSGYWIQDRGWMFCRERWRYVPYNY